MVEIMNWHVGAGLIMTMHGIRKPLCQLRVSGPMQMQIAGMHCVPANSGRIRGEAHPLTVHKPCGSRAVEWVDRSAMEFVTIHLSPGNGKKLIMICDHCAVAQR